MGASTAWPTSRGDLVLGLFLGSGSTAIAAEIRRRFVGYDTEPTCVGLARLRAGVVQPGLFG